jgi:hypothetical protein
VSNEPSFYSLFRRSRYICGQDHEQAASSRQNRRELYAVAAVAFVIKYAEDFRLHFLSTVCGIELQGGDVPTFEVQPFDHSDFAIKEKAGRWLVVVEFKVGANLEEKQNPGKAKSFFAPNGYGQLILKESAYRGFERKVYVVVNDAKYFDDATQRGLECKSRTWSDLAFPAAMQTDLWGDLLHSLGDLGVAAFQLRKLKNMNNAQYTTQAVAMHQTLTAIGSKKRFGPSGKLDINMEGEDAWYGRNIPLDRLVDHIFLHAIAGVESSGWFGYQAGPNHWELAIWIYCESEEAASNLRNYMQVLLAGGPSGKTRIEG